MPGKTVGEWRYSSRLSYLPALDGDEWFIGPVSLNLYHQMGVSDQLQGSAALAPAKAHPVATGEQAGWP
jgi:hypothetical protein